MTELGYNSNWESAWATHISHIINNLAIQGWEYMNCIASDRNFNALVFKRERKIHNH